MDFIDDCAHPFVVLKYKGKWSIRSGDLDQFFSVQREAMDAAIRLANESGKEGKPAVVLLQKSKTEFQKIWTSGESPYPPGPIGFARDVGNA